MSTAEREGLTGADLIFQQRTVVKEELDISWSDPEISDNDTGDANSKISEPVKVDDKKNDKVNGLKNKIRFNARASIQLYCPKCNALQKKVNGKQKQSNICKKCNLLFHHRCLKCNESFDFYYEASTHVKFKCIKVSTFNCDKCYYETSIKEHFDKHCQNEHVIEECIDCGQKFQLNVMKKHKTFECKSRLENISFRKSNKKKIFCSFMKLYCKKCDTTIEKVKEKGYERKTCVHCSTELENQCVTCFKRYNICSNNINLYNHSVKCNDPTLYNCEKCDYETYTKQQLTFHIESNHVSKQCDKCGQVCKNARILTAHVKYKCKNNPRYKGNRPQKSGSLKKLSRISRKLELKAYCSNCDRIFEKNRSECSICHKPRQFRCLKCNALRNDYASAYQHIRRCCQSSTNNQTDNGVNNSLEKIKIPKKSDQHHQIVNHLSKCPHCSKKLKDSNVESHMEYCSKFYECGKCDFATRVRRKLVEHLQYNHTTPFVQEFPKNNELIDPPTFDDRATSCDLLSNTPFYCIICNFEATSEESVKRHERKAHALTRELFSCDGCFYMTFERRDFVKHMQVKHNIEYDSYECPGCGRSFQYKKLYNKHLQGQCFGTSFIEIDLEQMILD